MADINTWIIANPMWIHIPIALCLTFFIGWWLWLVRKLGFGFAALKLRKHRFLYAGAIALAAIWGLYASSLFEIAPIFWL